MPRCASIYSIYLLCVLVKVVLVVVGVSTTTRDVCSNLARSHVMIGGNQVRANVRTVTELWFPWMLCKWIATISNLKLAIQVSAYCLYNTCLIIEH